MSAHPMITPLPPLRSPEEIAATYPPESAAVYRLIWDNMLAHVRSPYQAREGIHHYQSGDTAIGLRTLETSSCDFDPQLLIELDGYRTDSPKLQVGALEALDEAPLKILSVEPLFVPNHGRETDVGALVDWLNSLRVTSQGRLGSILGELEKHDWIELEGTQYRLTPAGSEQLQKLTKISARLDGVAMAKWRISFESYLSDGLGLEDLLIESNKAFGTSIEIPIDELEQKITGYHSAADAYALRDNQALKDTDSVYFPAGMDPERFLPKNSPLRIKRDALEKGLTEDRAHAWLCLSQAERIAIRCGAAITSFPDNNAVKQFLEDLRFDVRLRWLIGIGSDANPPTEEAALRSYNAWISAK